MNYVIYGEEQYQVKKQMNAIITREVGNSDEMNTVHYDAVQVSLDVILEDAQTIPFFADKKVIIVNNANFLSSNNDTEIDLDRLEEYLNNPMDTTILILSGDFAKLDARKKIVKKISTLCKVSVCNKLDKGSLPSFIQEEIQKRGILLKTDAMRELCNRLPYDIASIHNELDKVALYNEEITIPIIKELVTRSLEEDVFLLVNGVVEKNIKQCFQIWKDLQVLNKDPIYLIALIASQFHLLYQVKVCLLKKVTRQEEIASNLGVHPYRVKLAIPVCQRLPIDDILLRLNQLAQLDQNIKAGKIEKNIGFEMFLLKVKG